MERTLALYYGYRLEPFVDIVTLGERAYFKADAASHRFHERFQALAPVDAGPRSPDDGHLMAEGTGESGYLNKTEVGISPVVGMIIRIPLYILFIL